MDYIEPIRQGGDMFFSAYCDQADAEILLGPDNVTDLRDGPFGLELHYRCHCGQEGIVYPKLSPAAA